MNLPPPKIMVQNKVNISYIHSSKPWSKPGLANIAADSAKISCGKQARVRQKMIGISLMWIDLRRRSSWKLSKTVKNGKNRQFLTVFQPLRRRKSTHINEIPIICCHTLACLPHEILTESAHRGQSNQRQCRTTRNLIMTRYSEYTKYWLYFEPRFLGVPSSWNIKYNTSKKT